MPKGSKILMADDDQMLLDMYKERLDLAGYETVACPNGEELVKKVHEFVPDLIMLDVMMPKMDGYATLAALKSDPQTKNIPVVMLTALMRDFNREKAIDTGADDYLIKSEAMPSDVITKIEQVLANYNKGFGATQTPAMPTSNQESSAPVQPDENIEFKPEPELNGPMIETEPVGMPPAPRMAPAPAVLEEVKKPLEERLPMPPPTPTTTLSNNSNNSNNSDNSGKKSYRVIWTIIIVVLLTSLINDLIIYFLFMAKK